MSRRYDRRRRSRSRSRSRYYSSSEDSGSRRIYRGHAGCIEPVNNDEAEFLHEIREPRNASDVKNQEPTTEAESKLFVRIRNLDSLTDEKLVLNILEKLCGNVVDVEVEERTAYVGFADELHRKKALEIPCTDLNLLGDRIIIDSYAKQRPMSRSSDIKIQVSQTTEDNATSGKGPKGVIRDNAQRARVMKAMERGLGVSDIPPATSKFGRFRNMWLVGDQLLHEEGEDVFFKELIEDIQVEVSKCGVISRQWIDQMSESGDIYIEMENEKSLGKVVSVFDGRWFGGKQIQTEVMVESEWKMHIPKFIVDK